MTRRARLLKFAAVGAAVAALYVLLYLAFLGLGIAQPFANGAAFLIAVSLQYVGQVGVTFRARLGDGPQAARFGAMIALGLLTSALMTGWAGPALGLAAWASASAVTLILPIQNYLFMSRWVFRPAPQTLDSTS